MPSCKRATDRPPAGEAALADRPDGADVLVRYSATPRDAPCETLDVAFRLRGDMLVGEPDSQVEVVWTTERALDDGAEMTLLLGAATVALPSQLERRGSRVALIARAPAAMLARYGSERRPTLVIADRKIELSDRQTGHLRTLRPPPADPRRRAPDSAESDRPRAPGASRASMRRRRSRPIRTAGQGWFCVETAGDRKQRTSACHRTAAECDESRAATARDREPGRWMHPDDVGGLLQLARRRGQRSGPASIAPPTASARRPGGRMRRPGCRPAAAHRSREARARVTAPAGSANSRGSPCLSAGRL